VIEYVNSFAVSGSVGILSNLSILFAVVVQNVHCVHTSVQLYVTVKESVGNGYFHASK